MTQKTNIPVYILCGGKSTRMQTEKGLVEYKDKPFIQWVINAVKPLSNSIYLVTNNEDYLDFNYPLVEDIYKDKGPVGGIHSALKHSDTEQILILSCDIPNITAAVLEKYLLNNYHNEIDVMMLSDNQKIFPLIGIYSKSVLDGFESAIKTDKLKLMLVIKDYNFKTIEVAGTHKNALVNINTKEELKSIQSNTTSKMITIKYFGEIAEATNCQEEQLSFSQNSLYELMQNLNKKYKLDNHDIIVAINQERVDDFHAISLKNNDEIAILPPFAGG